ncbi:hypothetical protein ARMGADRAFT_49730 [Armillaria gallica]|uniref:Uncharacterized protein n=1 Tax=Armillaria gallica TaxID=47427 RepID=A0A2H3EYD3_ARMGA|nr:hypothetical protein ARMGADRAFT_49730 [Armillaria gallica]
MHGRANLCEPAVGYSANLHIKQTTPDNMSAWTGLGADLPTLGSQTLIAASVIGTLCVVHTSRSVPHACHYGCSYQLPAI